MLDDIAAFVYNRYCITDGIDGWSHILQTVHFGMMIACGEDVSLIIPATIGCFLHDIGRGREVNNQSHGEAGYNYCVKLKDELLTHFKKYGLSQELFDTILEAIRNHDKGKISNNVLIGIIWDADRLSLLRFNNLTIDKNLLSTQTAKKLIDYAQQYIYDQSSMINQTVNTGVRATTAQ